jgi:hypothetical protein
MAVMGNESIVVRGCICICSRGIVGVVTSDVQQKVTYNDGSEGIAWVGLTFDKTPWCSRNPEIIGLINELYLRELESGTREYL